MECAPRRARSGSRRLVRPHVRYLEQAGLVSSCTPAGYRLYSLRALNQLRSLAELRRCFELGIGDLAFAVRLRRELELRAPVEGWLGSDARKTKGPVAATVPELRRFCDPGARR
jgi:hypothetical protein